MSNYAAHTFHPKTGNIELAEWLDNYSGPHQYGVRFPDGKIFQPWECEQVGPKAMKEIVRLRIVEQEHQAMLRSR